MKSFTLFLIFFFLPTTTWAADVCQVIPYNCETEQKPPYPTLCSYQYDCTATKPTFQNITTLQLIKKMAEAGYDLKTILNLDLEHAPDNFYYFVR